VTTDYDLFVVNGSGQIVAGSAIDNGTAQQPIEFLEWGNTSTSAQTVRIVIARFSGAASPPLKFVFVASGGITAVEHSVSSSGDVVGPAIVGHAATSEVNAVAAVPYTDASTSEDFSSRGPETHYYVPTPGTTPLVSPEVIAKPDFAATDGVRTSFFAQKIGGVWRFYGTSAAAPQAAAVGALLRSKNPTLTTTEVRAALHDTARAVTTNGTADDVGGGYIDANAALASVTALAGKPRAVHATPGDDQATVRWTPPASDGGIPITGYTVTPYLNGVPQTPQTFNTTATTQVATGLTNGMTYEFTVIALDANGPGSESDPSELETVGAPTKPTGVGITAGGDARVTLAWTTPAADNGAPITGYTITPSIGGVGQTPRTVGVQNSATVTGLTNGATYSFRITATNSRGSGEASDATAPFVVGLAGKPSAVAAVAGNALATVTYHPPAPNGTHVTGYHIAAYEGSSLRSSKNYSTATKQLVHGLVNGHAYKFQVRAITSGGQGPVSAFSKAVVVGVPAAPTKVSAQPGHKSATVKWAKPADRGSAITAYRVTVFAKGVAKKSIVFHKTATTETISGLATGRTLTFVVVAINKRGAGPPSAHSKPVRSR
jgi:titin